MKVATCDSRRQLHTFVHGIFFLFVSESGSSKSMMKNGKSKEKASPSPTSEKHGGKTPIISKSHDTSIELGWFE